MADLHTYSTDDIDITFDLQRCVHAGECVHGAPGVFDPKREPWIDPASADAEAVAEVVTRCPTGALKFRRKDGGPEETVSAANKVTVAIDGPLYVRGDIRIETPEGEVVLQDTRVALCRCGLSKQKPFCDRSHVGQFESGGQLGSQKFVAGQETTELRVILSENGPLLLRGPVTLTSADGATFETAKCALCRCGQSFNKPFCDGTHRGVGFQASMS